MLENNKLGQIPLHFGFVDNITFANFHPGDQELLLDVCRSLISGSIEKQLFIHTEKKQGKTHLLTACCHFAQQLGHRIAYVPAEIIVDKDALLGLDSLDLVCIDDVEKLPLAGELALFNLINELRDNTGKLVISSNKPPSDIKLNLPDLVSRFSWGPVFQLQKLTDEQVKQAFQMRARSLGLHLPEEVAEFIFNRQIREITVLDKSLLKLVAVAVVEKRRFTIPFVKEVLNL